MRHNYDGAEARIQYGNTLDKDSGELDSSAIFGVGKGDTNITGVLNYYHRNSIFQPRSRVLAHPAVPKLEQ